MVYKVLDSQQRLAVFFAQGQSVIVEAPPGHGKTFVMARRIQHLIQSGWIKSPQKILGLTFSNVAASEMQDEIKAGTQRDDLDLIRVMTFHSFGYKVLRAYGNLIGLDRNFQIIGETDRSKIFQVVAARVTANITEEQFLEWIREKLIKGNAQWNTLSNMEKTESLYHTYLEELGVTRLDYDGLLLRLLELFDKQPEILEVYRSVFRYILVDEFQDTNPLQFKVLSSLVFGNLEKAGSPTPVFILADKKQAIYRFQGASPENIELAKNKFKCHEIVLKTNYRSSAVEILSFTKALRDINAKPSDKKVPFTISPTPLVEAQLILDRISRYQGALDNICVIAQNEYQLIEIRNLLDMKKIPYVFIPDFRSKSIQRNYESVFSAISNMPDEKNYAGKLSTKIRQIYDSVESSESDDDVLKALLQLAVKFDSRGERTTFSERARQFYNDIFIQINWGALLRKTVKRKVFLSTIHGVKGLQFSQVHLCGLSCFEHIHHTACYPCSWGRNKNSVKDPLDDAAKTLYVGTSRAQNELFLYSTSRNARGKLRKVLCLLKSYKAFLDISGEAAFCGD